MVYKYRGTETIEAEQQRQEQLKAELAAERERLKEAMRVRRENERLEAQILRTRQRTAELAQKLPEPLHGGYAGLRRAAQEVTDYNRRHRTAA
jgi:predicted  nucleic acid-binding Zn-ribbon protein